MENNIETQSLKKILLFRLDYIQEKIERKNEEIVRISPLINRFKLPKLGDFFKYSINDRVPTNDILPYHILVGLLDDILHCYPFYERHEDVFNNTEFFEELLDLVSSINDDRILSKLVDILKLTGKKSEVFFENIGQKVLGILNNQDISSNIRLGIFNIFARKIFLTQFESLLPFLQQTEQNFLEIQIQILRRLNKESTNSPLLNNIHGILINLYNECENDKKKHILKDILIKLGKMCGNPNCNLLINQTKNNNEITFCFKCRKTYCEKCLIKDYKILKCDICNKLLCQEHYNQLNLESENIELCENCLNDGKFNGKHTICTKCQTTFYNCGNEGCIKIFCVEHERTCILCGESYCLDCADSIFITKDFGNICPQCEETAIYCDVCNEKLYTHADIYDDSGKNAYKCDDCGKCLCTEHVHSVGDWGKDYCDDCHEAWKDYVWTMKTEGH